MWQFQRLPLQVSFPIFHIVRRKKSFSRKASNVQGSPDAEETQTRVHKNDLFAPILFSNFISNRSAPFNIATCSEIQNTIANSRSLWQLFLERPLFSLMMGFNAGPKARDVLNSRQQWPNGTSTLCHHVPLNYVLLVQFITKFFVPCSVKALKFTLQRYTISRRGCFSFLCSPQDSGTRLCLYSVSTNSMTVCCVYISTPNRNGWHICEHFLPKSCLFIYHHRTKTCGRGIQEIGFHTTSLGWTFQ